MESGEQGDQGGLARPGHADQGQGLARGDVEVDAGEDRCSAAVGEAHALEPDPPRGLVQGGGAGEIGDARFGVEHLEDPVGGRRGLLGHGQDLAQGLDGPYQQHQQGHEGHKAAEGEVTTADRQRPEQQHRGHGEVRDHVDERPEAGAQAYLLEARLPQQAGLVLEPAGHEAATPEGLDDTDAGGGLLHEGGEVAVTILHLAGDGQVLPLEATAEEDERYGGKGGERGEGSAPASP
ncbi:hypothetical protein BH23ACT1_BH23ACT1_09070 [soil metagenome]